MAHCWQKTHCTGDWCIEWRTARAPEKTCIHSLKSRQRDVSFSCFARLRGKNGDLRVEQEQWWCSLQMAVPLQRLLFFVYTWLHCYYIKVTNLYIAWSCCVCKQYKLCCLFSGWFAKEANVANNKQPLANFMTQSQRRTGTLWMLRDRKLRQTSNSEGWRPSIQEHTISYRHTERVTRKGVENWHFCIGNHWFRRKDALYELKQCVRHVLRT